MLLLMLLNLLDFNTIPFECKLETTNRSFSYTMILDNMTLKIMNRLPVKSHAIVIITPQIYLLLSNHRWSFLGPSRTKIRLNASIELIYAFIVMVTICKSF
jgi:hypothetical protein